MSLIGQMVIIKYSEVETNLVSKISKSPDLKKKKKSIQWCLWTFTLCCISQLRGHIHLFGGLMTDPAQMAPGRSCRFVVSACLCCVVPFTTGTSAEFISQFVFSKCNSHSYNRNICSVSFYFLLLKASQNHHGITVII